MDRILIALTVAAVLALGAGAGLSAVPERGVQPVFFSMLFPQLMPDGTPGGAAEATAGEAVPL